MVNFKHGHAKRREETAEYRSWAAMKRRCLDPQHKAYKYYGGRNIIVCEQWKYFENFFRDIGNKPTSKHSLDRIDNNGNYEPSNCRWATTKEQNNNQRTNRKIDFGDGVILNRHQIIFQWGIERDTYLKLFDPDQMRRVLDKRNERKRMERKLAGKRQRAQKQTIKEVVI